MLSLVRTAAPATTPVSLAETKVHLAVDHTDHDGLITIYIQAATDQIEKHGHVLVTQSWRADLDEFWDEDFRLTLSPIQSITTVEYHDGTVFVPVTSTNYTLFSDALGYIVGPIDGFAWPATTIVRPDAVRVTFVAGYGAAAAVPSAIKAAILLMVGSLYKDREATIEAAARNPVLDILLSPYRRMYV